MEVSCARAYEPFSHTLVNTTLTHMIHEVGFEPTKPKHGILSPAHLTALVPVFVFRMCYEHMNFLLDRADALHLSYGSNAQGI
jgi:hypothetical protein